MKTNSHYLLMAVLLLATATGWAAEFPNKLAGYTLGTRVRLTGEDKDQCPVSGKTFDKIDCKVTAKTRKLWSIDASYSDAALATTTFEALVAVRQKKYGPPTKAAQDLHDCYPGKTADIEAAAKLMSESKCAIWENALGTMTLYSVNNKPGGTPFTVVGLRLISKPLMTQSERETAAMEARQDAKEEKKAKNQAEKLLESE